MDKQIREILDKYRFHFSHQFTHKEDPFDLETATTKLTHLIDTEKKKARIDELKDMLEADNDPTQCVHCEILSRIKELES